MQFFIVTNIFNHNMSLENVGKVMCSHELLCFEVLNIRPVLYCLRKCSKKCWEAIRIIGSKSECQAVGEEQSLRAGSVLRGCAAGLPLHTYRTHISDMCRTQEPNAASQSVVPSPEAWASLGSCLEMHIHRPKPRKCVPGSQRSVFQQALHSLLVQAKAGIGPYYT